jgi:hypothetical protein
VFDYVTAERKGPDSLRKFLLDLHAKERPTPKEMPAFTIAHE